MLQKHLIFQVKMTREKSFVQYRGLLMEGHLRCHKQQHQESLSSRHSPLYRMGWIFANFH